VNEGAQKGILEGILCVFMISGDAVRIPDKPSRVKVGTVLRRLPLAPALLPLPRRSSHIVDSPGIASRIDEMFLFCEQT